jgi:hypothetical protein
MRDRGKFLGASEPVRRDVHLRATIQHWFQSGMQARLRRREHRAWRGVRGHCTWWCRFPRHGRGSCPRRVRACGRRRRRGSGWFGSVNSGSGRGRVSERQSVFYRRTNGHSNGEHTNEGGCQSCGFTSGHISSPFLPSPPFLPGGRRHLCKKADLSHEAVLRKLCVSPPRRFRTRHPGQPESGAIARTTRQRHSPRLRLDRTVARTIEQTHLCGALSRSQLERQFTVLYD